MSRSSSVKIIVQLDVIACFYCSASHSSANQSNISDRSLVFFCGSPQKFPILVQNLSWQGGKPATATITTLRHGLPISIFYISYLYELIIHLFVLAHLGGRAYSEIIITATIRSPTMAKFNVSFKVFALVMEFLRKTAVWQQLKGFWIS